MISADVDWLCILTAELTQSCTQGMCIRGYTYLRHTLRERRAGERRKEYFITLHSEELLSMVANGNTDSQFAGSGLARLSAHGGILLHLMAVVGYGSALEGISAARGVSSQ